MEQEIRFCTTDDGVRIAYSLHWRHEQQANKPVG